jgi:hypothetical protein
MRHHRQAADDQIPNTRRVQCAYYRLDAPQFHFNFCLRAPSMGKLPPLVIGEKKFHRSTSQPKCLPVFHRFAAQGDAGLFD